MRSKTLRGLDLIVYINGRPWAVCDSVDYDVDYGTEDVYGIDNMQPQEIASHRVRLDGSLHFFRQHNSAGVEGIGIAPVESELTRERYFYLQIVDRQTDTTYFEVPKAKIRRQRGGAKARGIAEGTLTFGGCGWANEF